MPFIQKLKKGTFEPVVNYLFDKDSKSFVAHPVANAPAFTEPEPPAVLENTDPLSAAGLCLICIDGLLRILRNLNKPDLSREAMDPVAGPGGFLGPSFSQLKTEFKDEILRMLHYGGSKALALVRKVWDDLSLGMPFLPSFARQANLCAGSLLHNVGSLLSERDFEPLNVQLAAVGTLKEVLENLPWESSSDILERENISVYRTLGLQGWKHFECSANSPGHLGGRWYPSSGPA